MTNEDSNVLYREFVLELERMFGKFDQFQFKNATNAFIAQELNYSNAQFSRLIHNTASHGELVRAVNAVKKLKRLKSSNKKILSILTISSSLLVVLAMVIAIKSNSESTTENSFQNSFETLFAEQEIQNFYTKLQDLPADCKYPCYKYQGKWHLKEQKQIPLLREKGGFHVRIAEATMYTACNAALGNSFNGYELETLEIWYDLEKRPFDFFIRTDSSNHKIQYYDTDFPKDKSFVKLGNIYSLIRHEFSIEAAGISKTSNIVTRNLEVIEAEFSKIKIEEKALMKEIEKITFGQSSRKPLQCEAASFPNLDFHSVGEGDTLEYRCLYNIKNYGNTNSVSSVIYEKTYLLTNQYITTPCQ